MKETSNKYICIDPDGNEFLTATPTFVGDISLWQRLFLLFGREIIVNGWRIKRNGTHASNSNNSKR